MEQKRMQRREGSVPAQAVQVKSREESCAQAYDDVWPMRISNSARRYQGRADVRTELGRAQSDVQSPANQRSYRATNPEKSTIPPRRMAAQGNIPVVVQGERRMAAQTADDIDRHSDQVTYSEPLMPRVHWTMVVGLAMFTMFTMFTMLTGWMLLTALSSWWQVTQDDWRFGRPRTYQVDQVVGHNDSTANPSHFIALNVNRHVEVIEFPGGDPSQAKAYIGPTLFGPGQDLAPVTLTFKDLTGDGRLDMVMNVQGSHFVFINEHGQFRPARPGENLQLG